MLNNKPKIKVNCCKVTKKGAQTWYAKFWWSDKDGKMQQKMLSTKIPIKGNNKRKADEVAEQMRLQLEDELNAALNNAGGLFSDFMYEWLRYKKHDIRLSTYEGYKRIIDSSIKPYFDNIRVRLTALTPKHIQDYYQSLLDRDLSANTVKHHHICINSALKLALKQRLIYENPIDRVTLPKLKPYEANMFTLEQLQAVLNACIGDQIEAAVYLGAYCGLRRSECLGLCWSDVDFENKQIHIHQTRTRISSEIFENNTKSKSSTRTLPLDSELEKVLLRILHEKSENKVLFGNTYTDSDFVCTYADGRPIKPDYLSKHFKLILENLGYADLNFHSLRHTAATLMTNSGEISLKTASTWLGHSNISTTSIYLHPDMKAKVQATKVLSDLINSDIQ